jgi:asparagine synthase (glutamine-hydrolysing)
MCGIAGICNISSNEIITEQKVSAMIGMLNHRGPDGKGYYVNHNIGLGHARLSIIDLNTGAQPIHNEDETVWVTFNGEIFNYIELRDDLVSKGHIFYTSTDTEVIVHLYEEHGNNFVTHLNGQFSIGLWDAKRNKLVLVRDRVGILPLFYKEEFGQLFFGSEVKAILAVIREEVKLNNSALDQIMTFWAPVSPDTIFENIFEVSPGQMIVVENAIITTKMYWDWCFSEIGKYHCLTENELTKELHDLLIDATKIRLRSDVPVGAYLSGGLDSSVITALIHNYGDVSLRTFSLGFNEESLDESIYQRQMISYLNAEHSKVQCSNQDIADNLLTTIWHTESPILRTAPVPMSLLSKLVREDGYKVVLTGEGADEVLGGYDIFKEGKIRQFWARNPDSLFRPTLLKKLYPYLDISKKQGTEYLKSFFGAELDHPELPYFAHIPRWTTTAKCKEFFSESVKQNLTESALEVLKRSLPAKISDWAPFNRSQYIESKLLMSGYLLCSQGDRMLMSNSVEGRFPFLDHRVIEFANSIDPKYKMKVLNEKYLLKQSMKKYLPESIVKRYKQPYRAPDIPSFFGTKPPEYIKDLLSEETINKYGHFNSQKVGRLVKKIERGRAIGYKDNMAFVGILTTQIWHHLFIDDFKNQNTKVHI